MSNKCMEHVDRFDVPSHSSGNLPLIIEGLIHKLKWEKCAYEDSLQKEKLHEKYGFEGPENEYAVCHGLGSDTRSWPLKYA